MSVLTEKKPIYDLTTQYSNEQLFDFVFRGIQGWLMRSYRSTFDGLDGFHRSYSNTLPGFLEGISELDMMDCVLALNAMLYTNVFPDLLTFHKFKEHFLVPIQALKGSDDYLPAKQQISKMYNFFVEGYLRFIEEGIKCPKTNDFYAHFTQYLFTPKDFDTFKSSASHTEIVIFFERVKQCYLKYLCGAYPNLDCFDGIFAFTQYQRQNHSPFEICLRGNTFKDIISSHSLGLLEDFVCNKKGSALKADLHNVICNTGVKMKERDFKALLQMIVTDQFTFEKYKKNRAEPEGRAILQQQLHLFLNLRQEGGCTFVK